MLCTATPSLGRRRTKIVALAGRRGPGTDGVEDYCSNLRLALGEHRLTLEFQRMPWTTAGWSGAFKWLMAASRQWRDQWVLTQYTPLMWSRHGLGLQVLPVMAMLRRQGALVGLVVHDPLPFGGARLRDRVRSNIQTRVVRQAAQLATTVISTVDPELVPWMQQDSIRRKARLIPVGSNVPTIPRERPRLRIQCPKVVIFGM